MSEPGDTRVLVRAVAAGKKPACEITIGSPLPFKFPIEEEALKLAEVHNLEIVRWEREGWENAAVGRYHDNAGRIFAAGVCYFYNLPFANEVQRLATILSHMTPARAVSVLLQQRETVPVAVCLGILFGFPPCCVHYFIYARRIGWIERESDGRYLGYVQCDQCFQNKLPPPWFSQ